MSEEQPKATEAEATAQVEEGVDEISEEDLAGVAGGSARYIVPTTGGIPGNQKGLPGSVFGNSC